jgi:hypothetical protein
MNVSSDALNTKENNDEHTGNDSEDGDSSPEESKSHQESGKVEEDSHVTICLTHQGGQGGGQWPRAISYRIVEQLVRRF